MWRRQEPIAGLTFAENDFIDMAQELALRGVAGTDAILTEQHARITNPDRKARFAFVTPALSPDAAEARRIFRQPRARREPRARAVGRRRTAIPESPAAPRAMPSDTSSRASRCCREIQRTGDIFFPLDWTNAVLGGHNSPAAAQTVTAFLAAQKDYPPRLRQVIEQNADQLIRAGKILG